MGPLIDRSTGAVRLGTDLVLTGGTPGDKLGNYITPGERARLDKSIWISPFSVNTIYGVVDISMHFKKGVLRSVKANLKSEFGPHQAMIKGRHDGLLTELLGRPTLERPTVRTLSHKLLAKALGQDWPKLTKELTWNHRWGTVVSGVDMRDGIAHIRVEWL